MLLLGFGLSAFYWIPIIFEAKYTQASLAKTVTVFPRPPWQAKTSEIHFAMALLTHVRLPQGLHMPNFFEDKLTMADASLFFSGVGLFLLDILASIAPDQRGAFQAEMSAWSKVYHRKFSNSKLLDDQIQMARAVTLCEMALPVVDAGYMVAKYGKHGVTITRGGVRKNV